MHVCNKCGRKFPPELQLPIRCFCDGVGEEITLIAPVADVDIEIYRLPEALSKEEQGRQAWIMLHEFIYENAAQAYNFYLIWKTKIPGFHQGCQCQSDFAKIEDANPPDFSSKEKFFEKQKKCIIWCNPSNKK